MTVSLYYYTVLKDYNHYLVSLFPKYGIISKELDKNPAIIVFVQFFLYKTFSLKWHENKNDRKKSIAKLLVHIT